MGPSDNPFFFKQHKQRETTPTTLFLKIVVRVCLLLFESFDVLRIGGQLIS